jgi:isocitrate lyase
VASTPATKEFIDYFLPIVADAEAGFGGVLNAFELMKNMIASGAAGVHFEDQLAAVKKCGHMGGKVLVPTREAVEKLISARFAADVMGVPTIVLARTDAEAANLLTSDCDANDKPFVTGERTQEGFYRVKNGLEQAISRGVAYAPYADLVWCETGVPDIGFAREFAQAVHARSLAQASCCRTTARLRSTGRRTSTTRRSLQVPGRAVGSGLQVPVHYPGWYPHQLVQHLPVRPRLRSRGEGMKHYTEMVQEPEFAARDKGYTFVSHQQEVGAGYFDDVTTVIQGGSSSVKALTGSTEEEQFH